jgi:Holliday junction DNA helicase RuvA
MAGGVGYKVLMTDSHLYKMAEGGDTALWIETIVREDALILIGFLSRAEQDMFIKLTGVSGIGPKLALAILGSFSLDALAGAIAAGDAKTLSTAPGVGKKVAERIIVELRSKVQGGITDGAGALVNDTLSALEALGYKRADVLETVQKLAKGNDGDTVQSLITKALKEISGGK